MDLSMGGCEWGEAAKPTSMGFAANLHHLLSHLLDLTRLLSLLLLTLEYLLTL